MFGKVLGAMIGAGVGLLAQSGTAALVLAVVGAIAGHLYDALHAEPVLREPELDTPPPGRPPRRPPPTSPADPPAEEREHEAVDRLTRDLCTLFMELARVDGEVVRAEVRVMKDYFERELGLDGRALNRVRNYLKAAKDDPPGDLEAAARAVHDALGPRARTPLLDLLYDLALADGELKRSEGEALRRVAGELGISEEAQREVAARYFGDGTPHYQVLGLSPSATDEELRSAFRRLAAQHHPDKAAHLGPRAVEAASRRFQQIKDAYEELRRLRGI